MKPSAPSWRRNQIAAAVATFMGFTGFTLVMPFLPLYFRQLGVHDVGDIAVWSGLSLSITPALTALLAPTWGRLGDRLGMKLMVERSLLSFVVVMGAMAFVSDAWQILALRAIQGFFAGYGALALSMVAESAPREQMAAAIGVMQTAQRLGPALGPVIGGAIAQLVGLRRAFLVAAAFYGVAFALLAVLYREPGEQRRAVGRAGSSEAVGFRQMRRYQNFVLLVGVVFGLQFVDRSFGPILPLYVAALGIPLDRVPLVSGVLFSVVAGSGAIGNLACGRLLRSHAPRIVIASSMGVAAAAAAVFVIAGSVSPVGLAMAVFGLAIGAAMTAAYTAAGRVIPPGAHGAAFGVLMSAALTGVALSPAVSGALAGLTIRAVFVLDAVILIVVTVVVSRLMVGSVEKSETSGSEGT